MKIEQEVITPEIAKEMLKKNLPYNRAISKRTVDLFVSDMKAGLWYEDTAATIAISEKGYLLDGQHRLTALVQYGKPLCMLVARDVNEAAFEYIDNGKVREPWQFMDGPQVKNRQAMAKFLCSLDKECDLSKSARGTITLTRQEILKYEKDHSDEIYDAVSVGARMREHVGMGSVMAYGGAAVVMHRLYGVDMKAINSEWLKQCKNSIGLIKTISKAYISAKSAPNTAWVMGTALQFLDAERTNKIIKSFNKQDFMLKKYSEAYAKAKDKKGQIDDGGKA